jgi:hypothetical protein
MSVEKKIPELGLAEFVSTLIRETFDAILTTQEEQTEKIAQIADLAGRSPEEVAASFISQQELDDSLQKLFPSKEEPYCLVYVGASYKPGPNEQPPVFEACGYRMQKDDYAGGKFTEKGYQSVVHHLRILLAEEKLKYIRQMVRTGVPRIQVDRGKILAKVSFSVRETAETATEPGDTGSASGVAPTSMGAQFILKKPLTTFLQRIDVIGGKPLQSLHLPAARMMVKQAPDSSGSSANTTNVYGEVEIFFRSVL